MWNAVKVIAVLAFLLVAVPFIYLMWSIEEPGKSRPEPTRAEINISNARYACRDAISTMLHDPDSAELGALWEWPAGLKDDDDSMILVQPRIRATNRFGAKVLANFQCTFDVLPGDDGIRLTDVREY